MKFTLAVVLAALSLDLPSYTPVAIAKKRRVKNFSRRNDVDVGNKNDEASSDGRGRRLQLQETKIKTVIGGNDIVDTNPEFARRIRETPLQVRTTTNARLPCTTSTGTNPCINGNFCFLGHDREYLDGRTATSRVDQGPTQCFSCPPLDVHNAVTGVPDEPRVYNYNRNSCGFQYTLGVATYSADVLSAITNECLASCFPDPLYVNLEDPNVFLGNVRYTDGGAYRPQDVVQRRRSAAGELNFAKNRQNDNAQQPVRFPAARSNFFINGECTTTASSKTKILQQSCFYNLCMGNGGYNCVNFFIGGPYNYDPYKVVCKNLENPPTNACLPATNTRSNKNKYYPELAPDTKGFVLGGTGSFAGITGTVSMQQQSGLTAPLNGKQLGLEVQLFTFKTYPKIPTPPGPTMAISNVADEAGEVAADPVTN